MRKVGKKGLEWNNAKIGLRKLFDGLGITYCEFRGKNCTGGGDTFAHVLKRTRLGKWGTDERNFNLLNVCRLCWNCHYYIDFELGTIEGGKVLQDIIDRRNPVNLLEDL